MEGANSPTIVFPANATACNSGYSGNTGLTLRHHVASTVTTPTAFVNLNFQTTYASGVSFGMYWQKNAGGVPHQGFDALRFQGGNGGGTNTGPAFTQCWDNVRGVCQATGGTTYNELCMEVTPLSGPASNAGCFDYTDGVWYWFTVDWTTTGADACFYNVDQTTGALGSQVIAHLPNGTTSSCVNSTAQAPFGPGGFATLVLGAVGAAPPTVTADTYYSNVLMDWIDSEFPLLPPSSATTTGPMTVSGSVIAGGNVTIK